MSPAEEGTRHAVTIRDFQPKDYAAVVEVSGLQFQEYRQTVEEVRHWDEQLDPKRFVLHRYVAVDATSRVVGHGHYQHMPWAFHPKKFRTWICVRPEFERRGIGSALYDRIVADLRERDARSVKTSAREDRGASVAFLERRGFREVMRSWESRLDLDSFDPVRFVGRAKPPPGIEIVTLAAELERDPDSLQKAYELGTVIAPDVPRTDPFTPPGFDLYRREVLEGPDALPDAFFLAKDGDAYVGQSDLQRSGAMPDELFTGFTGVLREYRGRGIAFALKLRAMEYAKLHRYRQVRTWNNTLNAPMLGINVKLGFVKQPVWIQFDKDLGGDAQ